MLRAGVVCHPSEWVFCGYNEIQHPHRKNKIIAYEQLMNLLGFVHYDQLTIAYRGWVDGAIKQGAGNRQPQWSESIAVGDEEFIEDTKKKFGIRAAGRRVHESNGQYELKDPGISYNAHFGPKRTDIDPKNMNFRMYRNKLQAHRLVRSQNQTYASNLLELAQYFP